MLLEEEDNNEIPPSEIMIEPSDPYISLDEFIELTDQQRNFKLMARAVPEYLEQSMNFLDDKTCNKNRLYAEIHFQEKGR